jgi:plasmid stability protein
MTRTVINIDDDIKQWLDIKAAREGVAMTELVRQALKLLREQDLQRFEQQLAETSGIWTEGDGLEFQLKERESWS